MILTLARTEYTAQTTLGHLYMDGEFFCYTLEDTVRAHGIKVYGETAIPAATYEVKITKSQRFERLMPEIVSIGKDCVEEGGISFTGIRMHGGNKHQDTHGCPLVARKRLNSTTIQGTMEKPLKALIKKALDNGEEVKLVVTNEPQKK